VSLHCAQSFTFYSDCQVNLEQGEVEIVKIRVNLESMKLSFDENYNEFDIIRMQMSFKIRQNNYIFVNFSLMFAKFSRKFSQFHSHLRQIDTGYTDSSV